MATMLWYTWECDSCDKKATGAHETLKLGYVLPAHRRGEESAHNSQASDISATWEAHESFNSLVWAASKGNTLHAVVVHVLTITQPYMSHGVHFCQASYTNILTCFCIYACVYSYVYIYTCIHMYTHTTCLHKYAYIYIHVYKRIYIYAYMYMYFNTHTHEAISFMVIRLTVSLLAGGLGSCSKRLPNSQHLFQKGPGNPTTSEAPEMIAFITGLSVSPTVGLQIAQSRSYLYTLGPKVGSISILGALGFRILKVSSMTAF